jgi:hypothetical protein
MSKQDVIDENPDFAAFCAEFGNSAGIEVLERIADAAWSYDTKREDIQFCQRHQINACNHIYGGRIRYAARWYGFVIESGDRNGTVVMEWGSEDDVSGWFSEPKPTIYSLVPTDDSLGIYRPEMFRVYLQWQKQKWFAEMHSGYNYDRHFAPGCKTEEYWRGAATKKGLKFVTSTERDEVVTRFNSITDAERAEWIQTTEALAAQCAEGAKV